MKSQDMHGINLCNKKLECRYRLKVENINKYQNLPINVSSFSFCIYVFYIDRSFNLNLHSIFNI